MRSFRSSFAIFLATSLLIGGTPSKAAEGLKEIIDTLDPHSCKGVENETQLKCITLEVPRDHRANSSPPIKIEFAVSFATNGPSKGVIVFATGGPGQSGLQYADTWLSSSYKKAKEDMDVVFFDQRGVGLHNGVSCPKAATKFGLANPSIMTPSETIAIAKDFATDCPTEFASQDLVGLLDTDQAVRDLELFRQAIGSPKIWIYGMSYGTQFAQRYATIFPTSVKGVVIDGVVDLHMDFDSYYAEYVSAAEKILKRVFDECGKIVPCDTDMNGNAAAVYDSLVARAAGSPIEVNFPLADGSVEKRKLTASMLASSAFNALYTPDTRAGFLQALAAASRDNLLPMLELSYSTLMVDPQTLGAADDSSYFPAAYYAITCSDYGEGTANADGTVNSEATAREIIERAKEFAPKAPRLLDLFYMERLVCAFWPKHGPSQRPAAFAGNNITTMILNADTDPITPITMARSVMSSAHDAYMIIETGGPHVMLGYGVDCVDTPVYSLIIDSKLPDKRQDSCTGAFIGKYTGLTLTNAADAEDPKIVSRAVETEIQKSVLLSKWNKKKSLTVGCNFGGTVTATAGSSGIEYSFADCAWWQKVVINGKGWDTTVNGSKTMALEIAVSGGNQGQVSYKRNKETDFTSITGTYNGKTLPVQ